MAAKIGNNMLSVVSVSHSRSSAKINIPTNIARATGLDKASHVIIVQTAENKVELKRYDKQSDLREYLWETTT